MVVNYLPVNHSNNSSLILCKILSKVEVYPNHVSLTTWSFMSVQKFTYLRRVEGSNISRKPSFNGTNGKTPR